MNRSIEIHALSALYRVLENDQVIEFIYQGGKVAGRPFFSFHIRGRAKGITSAEANNSLNRLKENLEATLAARSYLCFEDADTKVANIDRSTFNWCGELRPQGVLVSSGQTLQKASSKNASKTISISPIIPNTVSTISIVDALLSSPRPVKVVVSVTRCSLTENEMQSIKKVLMSINLGKAAYLMLPERRNLLTEEREILLDKLSQHLTTWLTCSWGIRLSCAVHASKSPSRVFMTMLGSALYPNRKVTFSEKIDGSKLIHDFDQALNLDLRDCLNAMYVTPKLFPNPSYIAEVDGIKRYYAEPKEIPSESGLCLGVAGGREVCISDRDRSRHTYLIGATGCGKSTLLYNMIMQDIIAGEGVCVMDPHGDLYHDVLGSIPKSRYDNVVLIDPCDFDYPVGINFLEVTGTNRQVEMGFITNEMIKIFDRLYDMRVAGGPIFEQYMRNTLLLVMDNDFSGTLMDVVRVLEDRDYRKYLKSICKNPFVVNFWNKQAEQVVGDAQLKNIAPYITSKLNQFTHNPLHWAASQHYQF